MDQVQKWEPALSSRSCKVTVVETSQEGPTRSQPPSLEQLRIGLRSWSAKPSSGSPKPLLPEQQVKGEPGWEGLGFPQKKKAILGHVRRRHRDHMAPYPVEREARVSPCSDKAQNQFRCKCQYCQDHGQNLSGEKNGASNPPSWETLVQGLSGLTLSLGANGASLLPEGAQQQQQEAKETRQLEQQQESKRMFQRLLKQWLKEN